MAPILAFGFGGPQDLIIILFCLLPSVFWVIEIVDVVRRQFAEPGLKIVWVLVVVLLHVLGALIYYFVGKRQGLLPSQSGAA